MKYDKTQVIVVAFIAVVVFVLIAGGMGTRENFWQKPVGMPISGPGMSAMDGSSLGGWTANEGLPVGSMPVNTPLDPNKLMLLADNKTSPECCPATFNNDTGCICLTENDRRLFASRGGNKA